MLLSACSVPAGSDRASFKEEIRREILAELRDPGASERTVDPASTGSVEGRLIFKKKGVPGCRVKLVRMRWFESFSESTPEADPGAEFETRTNDEGCFAWRSIPCGRYRLLWQVPGDNGWIRRAAEKPDAVVESGRNTVLADIDLGFRPIATVGRFP